MLLFIGGAARTGKGILARRLLVEAQMPYLSLDVLKMGLARGVPEFVFDPNAGSIAVAERLWPLVYEMSRSLIVDRVDYVLEGELLPGHVARLCHAHPTEVRACFLGYATIDPQRKLAAIRSHSDHPNDWPREYTDAELFPIINREIAFSLHVQHECATYGVPYFDTSDQFIPTLDAVIAYIRHVRYVRRDT